MSENRIQKEPSTEEILGSIRRIITEDNAQAGGVDASGAAQTAPAGVYAPTDDMAADEVAADMTADEMAADMTADEVAPTEMAPTEATPTEATPTEVTPTEVAPGEIASGEIVTEGDEILELTDEVVDEEPALDNRPDDTYQPEEERCEPRFGLSAAPSDDSGAEGGDDDRREPVTGIRDEDSPDTEQPTRDDPGLADAVTEPLAGYNYSPQVLSSNQDTAGEEEHSMASTTDGEPDAPDTPDTWETSQPAADPGGVQEGIVSQAASTAAASALGDLNRAVSEKTDKLKVGAETTVADIVKEMLRPMLREWLDENLPLIVDRVVRREIQKLVDRTQDDE